MEIIIPLIITALCVYGLFKRVNIFESFVDGVKEGMRTVVFIAPTMIALLLAVGMLRASGLLDWIAELIRPAAEPGIPAEVKSSVFLGTSTHYFLDIGAEKEVEVILASDASDIIPDGTKVSLQVVPEKINVFGRESHGTLIRKEV